jgi:uncharacterized protein YprB with RNaseH-like and TPR domain
MGWIHLSGKRHRLSDVNGKRLERMGNQYNHETGKSLLEEQSQLETARPDLFLPLHHPSSCSICGRKRCKHLREKEGFQREQDRLEQEEWSEISRVLAAKQAGEEAEWPWDRKENDKNE